MQLHHNFCCASVLIYDNESPCFLQQGKETQLLHVFEEDLIIGNQKTEDLLEAPNSAHSGNYARDFYATVCHTDHFLLAFRQWLHSKLAFVFYVFF